MIRNYEKMYCSISKISGFISSVGLVLILVGGI
uniref:Uncharacterized protein n=1 Tax=Arundo donax TaxID=35708 RepID=A0A0A9B4I9_ARUDO